MIPPEKRAGLGFEIIGQGNKVFATLYAEKGTSFVALNLVPHEDGRLVANGVSTLEKGASGEQIVWRPKAAPLKEISQLFKGYVAANGWKGSPEALERLSLL
jgi:hypothetical protein